MEGRSLIGIGSWQKGHVFQDEALEIFQNISGHVCSLLAIFLAGRCGRVFGLNANKTDRNLTVAGDNKDR